MALQNRWLMALLLVVAEFIALLFVGLVVQALGQSTVAGVFQMLGFVVATAPIVAFVAPEKTLKSLGSPRAFALTTLAIAAVLLVAFFFIRFTAQG